jgi:hypothetical protein
MDDLNTRLSNHAYKLQGLAERSEAEAASLRKQPKSGWAEFDFKTEQEAKAQDEQARRYRTLKAIAEGGKFGVFDDNSGLVYQYNHSSLYDAAASEHRAVHLDPETHKPIDYDRAEW